MSWSIHGVPIVFNWMAAFLKLLHLGCHGRLAPFLVGAGNGGFLVKELLELAADCGCIVVAGDFAFDLVEDDVAVVTFEDLGGRGRSRDGIDVLFVSRGVVLRGGFGVGFFAVRCAGWTAGTTRCFGHCGSLMVVGELVTIGVCLKDRVVKCKGASEHEDLLFISGAWSAISHVHHA